MIQRCRACGIMAGGLVSNDIPMTPWPQPDLCPQCPANAPGEDDATIRAILEEARRQVGPVIQAERAGEFVTGEIMGMRLR